MKILKRLFIYYFKYLPRIILGILAIVLLSQFDILNGLAVGKLVDILSNVCFQIVRHEKIQYILNYNKFDIYYKFIGQNQVFKLIIFVTTFIFINTIIKGFFVYTQEYCLNSAVFKSLRDIRQFIYKKIIKYPMSFYDQSQTGDLMAKITNDVGMIQGTFLTFNQIVKDFIQSILFLVVLFFINWKLSLLIILMVPLAGYILKKFALPIRNAQQKIVENISHITSFLQETLSGIKVIKIFVKEKNEINRFNSLTQSTYARNMKSVRLVAFLKPINELLQTIGVIMVILFAAYQMLRGEMTIGVFTTYIILANMVYKPVRGLGKINLAIQRGITSGTRIFELMDRDTEQEIYQSQLSSKRLVSLKKIDGQVEFQNISFLYKRGDPVLKNISFKANPGNVIAIVGHSGSGKTTIVNLIPQFYKIKKGKILIDNIDIKNIEYMSLRQFIGMVPQDTFLFSGTIKDNIAYAREKATFDQIVKAARQANAHSFIMKFKNKYDTEVGEKDVQLSGGEKQRISIARAILNDPKILILDEATSALDTKSEILVQTALNYLMKNRTTFIIAHRLSTIQNADKILVIENGKIVQIGSHKELIKNKRGLYFKLCNAQKLFK